MAPLALTHLTSLTLPCSPWCTPDSPDTPLQSVVHTWLSWHSPAVHGAHLTPLTLPLESVSFTWVSPFMDQQVNWCGAALGIMFTLTCWERHWHMTALYASNYTIICSIYIIIKVTYSAVLQWAFGLFRRLQATYSWSGFKTVTYTL